MYSSNRNCGIDQKLLLAIGIFPFWPLGSALYAIYNYSKSWSKNIFWLYAIYFGYSFHIPLDSGIDALAYWQYLETLYQGNASFSEVISTFYSVSPDSNLDIIQPLITFVLAQFTDNYHILYLTVGAVYGYFFSRNVWFVLNKSERRFNFAASSIVILLLFIIPLWDMNGIRFWTASHIFIYGALKFLYTDDKSFLLVSACSFFMHFTFIFPTLLLLGYLFIGNRYRTFYWVFIASLPISFISFELLENLFISVLPNVFQDKISAYLSYERYQNIEYREQYQSIFSDLYQYILPLITTAVLTFNYTFIRRIKKYLDVGLNHILAFSALFLAVMNFLEFIPSFGRFNEIPLYLLMSYIFLSYQRIRFKEYDIFLWVSSPLFIIYALGQIRLGIGSTLLNIKQFLGSPIYFLVEIII